MQKPLKLDVFSQTSVNPCNRCLKRPANLKWPYSFGPVALSIRTSGRLHFKHAVTVAYFQINCVSAVTHQKTSNHRHPIVYAVKIYYIIHCLKMVALQIGSFFRGSKTGGVVSLLLVVVGFVLGSIFLGRTLVANAYCKTISIN